MIPIRETAERELAEEWSFVLHAVGIESAVRGTGEVWQVVVRNHADLVQAEKTLAAYEQERTRWVRQSIPMPEWGPTWAGFAVVGFLIVFHIAVSGAESWSRLGAGSVARILHGEWWRTVTAVTLHANAAHLAGNVFAGGIFFTALFRLVGPGTGLCSVLACSAAANFLDALSRRPTDVFLGASTGVFASVGILSGYRFFRYRSPWTGRDRRWIPLGAGLALLGWLGTAPHSDLLGHFLGFVIGLLAGNLLRPELSRPKSPTRENFLLGLAAVSVLCCWTAALTVGTPFP